MTFLVRAVQAPSLRPPWMVCFLPHTPHLALHRPTPIACSELRRDSPGRQYISPSIRHLSRCWLAARSAVGQPMHPKHGPTTSRSSPVSFDAPFSPATPPTYQPFAQSRVPTHLPLKPAALMPPLPARPSLRQRSRKQSKPRQQRSPRLRRRQPRRRSP